MIKQRETLAHLTTKNSHHEDVPGTGFSAYSSIVMTSGHSGSRDFRDKCLNRPLLWGHEKHRAGRDRQTPTMTFL